MTIDQTESVVVVEASAGSGKTHELATRFVTMLLADTDADCITALRRILAITFTNRATREMKERVLSFLKKLALQQAEPAFLEAIAGAVGLPRQLLSRRAAELVDTLLCQFSSFQILTIDSFVKTVLNSCSRELGLSARFRIRENTRQYIAYSVDEFLESCVADPDRQRQLQEFVWHYLAITPQPTWQLKRELIAIFSELFAARHRYGKQFQQPSFDNRELFALKTQLLNAITALGRDLPPGVNKRFAQGLQKFAAGCDRFIDFESAAAVTAFKKKSVPLNKGIVIDAQWQELWQQILRGLDTAATLEAAHFFDVYLGLFSEVERNFTARSSKEDVMFLDTLNERCGELFDKRQFSLPELFYRLAIRFRHVLIDEFQDTSRLQWRNLLPIVSEALATGGTLFYVGDKKQAIYRFRGGDVELFDQAYKDFAGYPVAHRRLEHNYRSGAEIVTFINEIFSPQAMRRFLAAIQPAESDDYRFLSAADQQAVLDGFGDARQLPRPDKIAGRVCVYSVREDEHQDLRAALGQQFLALTRDILQRRPAGDIAVLCRSNDQTVQITEWLAEATIPAESERTVNILNNSLIQELLCLVRVIGQIDCETAFSGIMLGDILERTAGIGLADRQAALLEFQRDGNRGTPLSRQFSTRWPEVWQTYFQECFCQGQAIPVYELLVALVGRFNLFEHFPESQGFVMRLLELAKEKETEYLAAADFIAYIGDAPAPELAVSCPASGVRVLTTHKAKGLAFPVVIVPFFDGQWRYRHTRVSVLEAESANLRQIRLSGKYAAFSTQIRALMTEEYRRSLQDEINTWYVSLTRAADELYIIRQFKKTDDSAASLLPIADCARGIPPAPRAAGMQSATPVLAPALTDWLRYLADEFDFEPESTPEQRARGIIAHELLARCISIPPDAGTEFYGQLVRQSATEHRFTDAESLFWQKWLRDILQDSRLTHIFQPAAATIYNELTVSDQAGRLRRVDRLIETPQCLTVVEFKFSGPEQPRHRAQVGDYIRCLKSLYPHRRVAGQIVYLAEKHIVELDCGAG